MSSHKYLKIHLGLYRDKLAIFEYTNGYDLNIFHKAVHTGKDFTKDITFIPT